MIGADSPALPPAERAEDARAGTHPSRARGLRHYHERLIVGVADAAFRSELVLESSVNHALLSVAEVLPFTPALRSKEPGMRGLQPRADQKDPGGSGVRRPRTQPRELDLDPVPPFTPPEFNSAT